MAERDYALEMWRLLDPEARLIGSKQLLDRVVCVKSGEFRIIIGHELIKHLELKNNRALVFVLSWTLISDIAGSCFFLRSLVFNYWEQVLF